MRRQFHPLLRSVAALLVAQALVGIYQGVVVAQDGTWTNTVDGQWSGAGNWVDSVVANGADNTADFSTVDIVNQGDPFYRTAIQLDSARTIGHIIFGDANTASPGGWEVYFTGANPGPFLTLGGASPTITVNPLGPIDTGTEIIDDAILRVSLREPAAPNATPAIAFTKLGQGTLTLDGLAENIAGVANIDEGSLRLGPNLTYQNPDILNATLQTITAFNVADGAALEMNRGANLGINTVNIPAAATGTLRGGIDPTNQGSFFNNVTGGGMGTGTTVNVELVNVDAQLSAHGTWGGIDTLNVSGPTPPTPEENARFRLRPNGGGFNGTSFQNTVVNVDTATLILRSNSQGNDIFIGELHGTATAGLAGGVGGGGVAHYMIGGLNTDSDFAGSMTTSEAGMDLVKIGTGTLTLSGTLSYSPVPAGPQSGNPLRRGGVTAVEAGTLKLTGTTSLPAGVDDTGTATNLGILPSTVDIRPGATLDVSEATSTYSTAAFQQVIGGGTIIGNYNHDEGTIAPGDDNVTVITGGQTEQSAARVPTAGTLTFDNDLSFSGGEIVYDMTLDPMTGNDLIQVNGSTMVGGGATINPNFLAGVPETGTYTILNSTGAITGSTGGWTVVWPGRGTPPSVNIVGNQLQFTAMPVTGGADLNWRGTDGNLWNINGAQNFHNNDTDSADKFFDTDEVTFADTYGTGNTAVTNTNVTVPGDVAPLSVTVDSTLNYSITGSGRITGIATFTKRGSGTLILQTPNTFSGPASIEEGTVDIGNAPGALGTGNLTLSGVTVIVANAATGGMTNSGMTLATGTTNTVQVDGGEANTLDLPPVTGDGDLHLTSTIINEDAGGKLIGLGDMSGFSGDLSAAPSGDSTAITLRVSPASSMPNSTVTLSNASLANRAGGGAVGTIAIGALVGDVGSFLDGFTGGSALPGTNFEIGALGTSTEFAGSIIDGESQSGGETTVVPTSLTKVGAGTLTLSNSSLNNYTGDTSVLEGTLSINNDYLDEGADVYLATGAVFDLDFGGTNIIDSLFIDGVGQAIGTYGSSMSSATFKSNLFLGTGVLQVSTVGMAPELIGDYNDDGVVDAADYTVYRDNLGTDFMLPNRDPMNMGNVNANDYTSWVNNFGNTAPMGSGSLSSQNAAVPEPSSLVLAVLLWVGIFSSGARRRR